MNLRCALRMTTWALAPYCIGRSILQISAKAGRGAGTGFQTNPSGPYLCRRSLAA
jgi:hypothetical protein